MWLDFGRRAPRRVGRLASVRSGLLFEYDADFIADGPELSPLRLPLGAGVFRGDPAVSDGLPGVFEDCLPDGWGRLLLDRREAALGVEPGRLGPLDRLAHLGAQTMGALTFVPSHDYPTPSVTSLATLEREAHAVFTGRRRVDLDRLIALGGSPQGARPKVLVQRSGRRLRAEQGPDSRWTSWMVKFRARDDDLDAPVVEHLWMSLAAACGLDTAKTELLEGAHFAVKRFDRDRASRLHLHSLAGLLNVPFGVPAVDYRDLLRVTRLLTRDETQVTEAYRRACFNVLAHNRDDHARNVAFLMKASGVWSLAPAFDLTPSHGPGGEHAMSVLGEGLPTRQTLVRLAAEARVSDAARALKGVERGLSRLPALARALGVRAPVVARLTRLITA